MTSQQIRTIRAWFGWSQTELADQLGVSHNTVTRWETGQRNPSRLATRVLREYWDRMHEEMRREQEVAA